jgi:hypothetical protein
MDNPIDHEGRKGRNYDPKPVDEEQRQKRSKAMKEFNRKTGKVTLQGNGLMQRRRMAKVPK